MDNIQFRRLHYPTVTEISGIYAREAMKSINPEILQHAAERGTKVHNYCAGLAQGFWLFGVEEECQPYVESFTAWMEENMKECEMSEERLYDDNKEYSGQIDMVMTLKDGRRALVDLKTSANVSRKSWSVQLAAYKKLLEKNSNNHIDVVLNLHLLKTGKIAKEVVYDQQELNMANRIFEANLLCFDFYMRKEIPNE